MVHVQPVPDAPAATTIFEEQTVLLIADYHAGIEIALRESGVELPSRATERRESLLSLVNGTEADRVVVLGDLGHSVGDPTRPELDELETLIAELPVPLTLVPGNHDAGLGDALAITVTESTGATWDGLGCVHGHSWPSAAVLAGDIVCMGHEHPMVRLEDEVGGSHVERIWLRGPLDPTPFEDRGIEVSSDADAELVVLPAFNERSGGTWVNVPDQEFLSPYLPAALSSGQAYLLDGTDLGAYRSV